MLPENLFDGLTKMNYIELESNALSSLPAGLISGLNGLNALNLKGNDLSSLPAGLLSGPTRRALRRLELGDNPNPGDVLPLTVTLTKRQDDQVRLKVLAGAPFAVDIPVTVVNGTLAGNATSLHVSEGRVDGTPLIVTRTDGTTAAVTVDVDLTTQPTLPEDHSGYEFVKATSGLPAEILPDPNAPPPPPPVTPFDTCGLFIELRWTPPDTLLISKYQYQIADVTLHATLANPSVAPWSEVDHVDIRDSAPGGTNFGSYTVKSYEGACLTRGATYYFTIRGVFLGTPGGSAGPISKVATSAVPEAPALTATPGDGQIVLNWTEPYDGGSAIESYQLMTDTDGLGPDDTDTPWEVLATVNGSTTSYTHTGLGQGVTRYYWVQAENENGSGPYSEPASATTTDLPDPTDATLSALVVTYGSSEVPLSPFFAPGTTSYTASVANAVAQVTVTPTTTHTAATIGYFDEDDVTLTDAGAAAGHQVDGGGRRQRHRDEGDGRGPRHHRDLQVDGDAPRRGRSGRRGRSALDGRGTVHAPGWA